MCKIWLVFGLVEDVEVSRWLSRYVLTEMLTAQDRGDGDRAIEAG